MYLSWTASFFISERLWTLDLKQDRLTLMDNILVPHMSTSIKEPSKITKISSKTETLETGGLRPAYKGTLPSGSPLVNCVHCTLHAAILMDGNWIHNRRMRLLLAIFLVRFVAMAPLGAIAQQSYNNVQGYTCNGRDRTCSTYALYRTFQAEESLAKVAGYFNLRVDDVSTLNKMASDSSRPQDQPLFIPLECSCPHSNVTSQMEVNHTSVKGDTFFQLATTIYGGLTKYDEAMMVWNPTMMVYNLTIGNTIKVPIFCACPTVGQIQQGTNFLLTSTVYPGETLDVISGYFGITTDALSYATRVDSSDTLWDYTTLLVPVVSLPPIPTMKVPDFIISPSSSSSTARASSSGRRKVGIILGLAAGTVAALLVLGLFIARCRRKWSQKQADKVSEFSLVDRNLVPRMFTFRELSKATKNFSRSRILGRGGFGAVYKGTLPSGALVAVKQMRMESKHGQESFQAEVTSLSHIRHRNLVQLRGWCHEEEQLLLVYDYMCNGSLDEWLFEFSKCRKNGKGKGKSYLRDADALPLKYRHSILSGVAGALSYLPEDCSQCVLHRDIKSSNVLLDGELNAYVGDFGLTRLIDHQKVARTTMMAGTLGYLAPEMPHTGKATKETDVYSFGILVLEVMCGMQPLAVSAIEQGEGLLEDRVWRAHEEGEILQVADSRLGTFPPSEANSSSFGGFESPVPSCNLTSSDMHDVDPSMIDSTMDDKKMITNLLHLGLLCCNPSPEDRRLVSQLMLQSVEEMEISMPCLPEWKPQVHYSRSRFRGFSQMVLG